MLLNPTRLMPTFPISSRYTHRPASLDRHDLYQSQSPEIRALYDQVLPADKVSLTTVRGNDVGSRFRIAYAQLSMTNAQRAAIQQLETALRRVEELIDPKRLYFTITSSPDEDIVLNHRQPTGLCTMIVHDDGSMAISRIYARTQPDRKDELRFMEANHDDYEQLVLQFLSGQ